MRSGDRSDITYQFFGLFVQLDINCVIEDFYLVGFAEILRVTKLFVRILDYPFARP